PAGVRHPPEDQRIRPLGVLVVKFAETAFDPISHGSLLPLCIAVHISLSEYKLTIPDSIGQSFSAARLSQYQFAMASASARMRSASLSGSGSISARVRTESRATGRVTRTPCASPIGSAAAVTELRAGTHLPQTVQPPSPS